MNCVCASKSKTGRTNVTLLFSYHQPRHKRKSVAMAVWNEESLTGVPYIFKPLIGIASKVAPPAALPFSCCTATSVSGPGSLEGGCLGGPAGTREPNWGPRTPPSAATAVLPLADGRIKTPWLARGQRSPGGCSVCRARGGSLLWWIRQCCPAVSMNFDWCPQPLSPSLLLKWKCKDDEIWISSLICTHCHDCWVSISITAPISFLPDTKQNEFSLKLGIDTVRFSWSGTIMSKIYARLYSHTQKVHCKIFFMSHSFWLRGRNNHWSDRALNQQRHLILD